MNLQINKKIEIGSLFLSFYLFTTFVSMATMSLGLVFLFLSVVLVHTSWRDFESHWQEILKLKAVRVYCKLSLALIFFCTLSLIFAFFRPERWGSVQIQIRLPQDLLKLWYFIVPLLHLLILDRLSETNKKTVIHVWLGVFLFFSLIGILQFYIGWPRPILIPSIEHQNRYHVVLWIGHHLSVASIWIFPFFYALDLCWRTRKPIPQKWLLLTAFAGGLTLIFTYARSVWLTLPVGLILWIFLSLQKKSRWIALASIILSLLLVSQTDRFKERTQTLGFMGVQERYDLWEANWAFFKMNPVIGLGFRQASQLSGSYLQNKYQRQSVFASHAHNNFLEMLASTGILGTLSWLAWSIFVFGLPFNRWRRHQSAPGDVGMIAAWITFHLNGLTQVNFWDGKVMHQMMWAVALGLLPCFRTHTHSKDRQRILIVKLCCLGDLLFLTPALRALKKANPHAELSLLCSPWVKDVAQRIPEIDQIIEMPSSFEGVSKARRLILILKTLRQLRSLHFDAAYVTHRSHAVSLFTWLSGIPFRIGFQGTLFLSKSVYFDVSAHETRRMLALCESASASESLELSSSPTSEDRRLADEWLQRHPLASQILLGTLIGIAPGGGINPGTQMTIKRWSPKKYAALIQELAKNPKNFFILFGDANDQPAVDEILAELDQETKNRIFSLVGKCSLGLFYGLAQKCRLLIGHDSGPLYIAAAIGTPTLSLFGPSDPRLVAPQGPSHHFIWKKPECSPCYTPLSVKDPRNFQGKTFICKTQTHECMTALSVEEVLKAAQKLFAIS